MFANESSFVHLIYLQIHYYFGVFWAGVDNPLVHTLQVTANQRTYYLCKLKFRFEKSRLQIYASSISENYRKLSLFLIRMWHDGRKANRLRHRKSISPETIYRLSHWFYIAGRKRASSQNSDR